MNISRVSVDISLNTGFLCSMLLPVNDNVIKAPLSECLMTVVIDWW